ncbi:MAG: tRNA threonylcarbamoyladenosine dehydratase [Clostridiales bacterium]|nr:tRNA threonylcarbamoyladenosine dehydratase [Clostridiales bacterium]
MWTDRTRMMLGDAAIEKLKNSRVAVFGLGGVGGHAFEALVRSGIGHITAVDRDVFDETNLNRQLLATRDSLGRSKAETALSRAKSIDPEADITALDLFYCAENAGFIDFASFDYVADCIDSVASKLLIIQNCLKAGVKVISCMGTGNKLDPSRLEVADISRTSVCPLARVMRRELRNRGIEKGVKVLFSTEEPIYGGEKARTPGSTAFVPGCAGLMIAAEIVRNLSGMGDV